MPTQIHTTHLQTALDSCAKAGVDVSSIQADRYLNAKDLLVSLAARVYRCSMLSLTDIQNQNGKRIEYCWMAPSIGSQVQISLPALKRSLSAEFFAPSHQLIC